ncbi:urea ABC transporter permease subunit UrtB [Anaeromyxobacter diazotrophicus]|uniref:Branched-chain amino acid ABC transporter permease n=1 Tax=Anaeromyxobacter diazotrophicus TaxID=2590199 RepID=A0A7I9VGD8_9BACT|nr:urea ABC transporter permease subunit UrtB [Anaeromyxobacter diazotrophicus]GEJ55453.1 branched-chain amino acid ABC transporter permease [Anaeromyxobacter diazotrophicus]
MRALRHLLLAAACAAAAPAAALDAVAVRRLASDDAAEKLAAVRALAQAPDPDALRVLRALSEGALQVAGDEVLIAAGDRVLDAVTGAEVRPAPEDRQDVTFNNRVRRELEAALAAARLLDPDRRARLAAAQALAGAPEAALSPLVLRALQEEQDPEIRALLATARAEAQLRDPAPAARRAAVDDLAAHGGPRARALVARLAGDGGEPDREVREAARRALSAIDARLARGELLARLFSGLSLGSILLLGALGLAITYGVMGVINMAHGELLMVGAYAAFAVQGAFRRFLPGAFDWYPLAAVPVAFLAAALVGAALERTVIRFLYRRPLETLLATWGASLLLVQAARMAFGAQNVVVANPAWMSGGLALAGAVLPWNRVVIVAFALAVLGAVGLVLQRTRLGMFVRAVTQNREMASCVGVSTGRVDTLAFALGSGIAGLGGLALSQVANVGPDMGQGYIVDAFMVVVLGGVGQLAGAVGAALGLGVASKLLEGWAGAVIAKIAVLAFVIVFIQKRPQGLFAAKGRLVEG